MMKLRFILLALAAAAVSACSGPQTASRNVSALDAAGSARVNTVPAPQVLDINIARVTVDVPRTLEVSEKNTRYPRADIVWRGDSMGNRYEQVEAILTESARRVSEKLNGTRPVHMHIQLTRFHGLTEKTRYSTGGVHNVNFYVTLYDAASGLMLREPRLVVSNLDGFGGRDAIAADARGETQKVRLTGFLASVLQDELTRPGGYDDNNRGFFVALNRS